MIRINSLSFTYPHSNFHLSIADFSVASSEKVAVIGPSGSGKTTLLKVLAGILTAHQGKVRIDDTEISAFNDAERRNFRITQLGYIFQDFGLLDYLTVLDNILHPYRITSALKLTSAVRKDAKQLAENMGIGDKLHRYSHELSQGEQQRAAICRALLPQPRLILADEATGNLDPVNKQHILDLLFQRVDQQGTTLLAVTHDHELLSRFDRVIDFQTFIDNTATA